jgi:RNA polymerase-binding transcription factor
LHESAGMSNQLQHNKESGIYRKMLLERRDAALAGLGMKVSSLTKIERVGDEDLAQHSHEEFVSLQLNGLEYLQLRQVEEALDRLVAGDYGVCQRCEEPIPAKRLHALPWAKYCVKCQEAVGDVAIRDQGPLPHLPTEEAA